MVLLGFEIRWAPPSYGARPAPIIVRVGRPVKQSVAIVVRDAGGRLLVVRRADGDPSLPGVWGLPGASLREGERPEQAAQRAGRDKLGIEVRIRRHTGDEEIDRGDHLHRLSEYEAELVAGEPSVPQDDASVSQYAAVQYTDDPTLLRPAARQGSLCSRILLRRLGLGWEAG
jgi:ADP-ribose pyrophosphatase YjhB (NUDIX family)